MEKGLKDIRIILYVFGGSFLVSTFMIQLIVKMQRLVFTMAQTEEPEMLGFVSPIHEYLLNLLPFLMILGVINILFAWQIKSLLTYAKGIVLTLAVSVLLGYVISVPECLQMVTNMMNSNIEIPSEAKVFVKGFALISLFIGCCIALVPYLIVYVKLKRLQKKEHDDAA